MAKTLQERFVEAFWKMGEREVKRTSKYIVFSRTEGSFYYIGRNGAVRVGRNVTDSVPLLPKTKQRLLDSV